MVARDAAAPPEQAKSHGVCRCRQLSGELWTSGPAVLTTAVTTTVVSAIASDGGHHEIVELRKAATRASRTRVR